MFYIYTDGELPKSRRDDYNILFSYETRYLRVRANYLFLNKF